MKSKKNIKSIKSNYIIRKNQIGGIEPVSLTVAGVILGYCVIYGSAVALIHKWEMQDKNKNDTRLIRMAGSPEIKRIIDGFNYLKEKRNRNSVENTRLKCYKRYFKHMIDDLGTIFNHGKISKKSWMTKLRQVFLYKSKKLQHHDANKQFEELNLKTKDFYIKLHKILTNHESEEYKKIELYFDINKLKTITEKINNSKKINIVELFKDTDLVGLFTQKEITKAEKDNKKADAKKINTKKKTYQYFANKYRINPRYINRST